MKTHIKLTAFILIFALLLTGCGYRIGQDERIVEPEEDQEDTEKEPAMVSVTSLEGEVTNAPDDRFTVGWDPNGSVKPFDIMCGENAALTGLIYEGLFSVTPDFRAENCLCESSTVSGNVWVFNLLPGVTFHDGSKLTAEDVKYSLELARTSERFASRLSNIASIEYVSELKLRVATVNIDNTLPVLLDIPVIKEGTEGMFSPVGTGPYSLDQNSSCLNRYDGYRAEMPLDKIYLMDITGESPASALSQRKADMILYDTSSGTLDVYIDHETHYFDTTILQYIGFNTRHYIAGYPDVRRAIGHLINRDAIVNDYPAGSAVTAPLALSRFARGYDETLESQTAYSVQTFTDILSAMNAADLNGDGWLELNGATLSFTFIVSDTSPFTAQAASEITDIMRSVGLNVILRTLPFEEYRETLENGDFDMYLAEVRLPANFDLTQILGIDGALNLGAYSGYDNALINYLMADTDEAASAAFKELCQSIYDNAPIIPICYKRNAVTLVRDMVKGVKPSQQNVFWNIGDWKIDN